uniref:Transmembrane protein n=1 Tax=Corethron hystrix TaxID=216773 RepID=A0A7S1FXL3_9STRA|mmetsp:Transcript_37238/g.86854  ORF Transcript_37238/g.86854 Transcript_37238/m.86854 type:complete len:170 (+) Transcript_37238:413-922(+)
MTSTTDTARRRSASSALSERRKHTPAGSRTPEKVRLNAKSRAELIGNKIHAILWVAAGGYLGHRVDVVGLIVDPASSVSRNHLYLAAVCFGINSVLMFYLAIYLTHIRRIKAPWEVYCPKVIPTMTVVGLFCAFFLMRAFWPCWGFLTPIIIFVLAMGALMVSHFVPFL